MLNTVLFDMGGTLEDIWNNQETQAKAMDALQKTLRDAARRSLTAGSWLA